MSAAAESATQALPVRLAGAIPVGKHRLAVKVIDAEIEKLIAQRVPHIAALKEADMRVSEMKEKERARAAAAAAAEMAALKAAIPPKIKAINDGLIAVGHFLWRRYGGNQVKPTEVVVEGDYTTVRFGGPGAGDNSPSDGYFEEWEPIAGHVWVLHASGMGEEATKNPTDKTSFFINRIKHSLTISVPRSIASGAISGVNPNGLPFENIGASLDRYLEHTMYSGLSPDYIRGGTPKEELVYKNKASIVSNRFTTILHLAPDASTWPKSSTVDVPLLSSIKDASLRRSANERLRGFDTHEYKKGLGHPIRPIESYLRTLFLAGYTDAKREILSDYASRLSAYMKEVSFMAKEFPFRADDEMEPVILLDDFVKIFR